MTGTGAALLSSSSERFQTVTIGDSKIIVSVADALRVGGEDFDIGGDYAGSRICLFAESVVLDGALACKSAIVAANAITAAPQAETNAPHAETAAPHAELKTSGAPGDSVDHPNLEPSTKGQPGGDGRPAGTLSVYLENAATDAPGFALSATGGPGGAGQEGIGAPGGDGGNGGDGGTVTLLAGFPPLRCLARLREVANLRTLDEKKQAIGDVLAMVPAGSRNAPGWRRVIDTLTAAEAAETSDEVKSRTETAGQQLAALATECHTATLAAIDVAGGAYGTYGPGTPRGETGKPGDPGSKHVVVFGTPKDLATSTVAPFFHAHPSQCARLLEIIRMRYLALDPVKDPQGVTDLTTLLTRLEARTGLFAALPDDSPLARHYAEHEQHMGAVGAVAQLRGINAQCNLLRTQLRHGQDSYGYDADWVPLGAFSFYKKLLADMIENFERIEQTYRAYFEALETQAASMDHVRKARQQNTTAITRAQAQLKLIQDTLPGLGRIIAGYESVLSRLKADLEEKIKEFKEELENNFDFDINRLLSALEMLAFAPESKFMLLTQLGSFSYQSATTITEDTGVPVEKAYLVSDIKAVGAEVHDLIEGVQSLDDGTLRPDDPGAGKLVAEEGQFRKTFAALRNNFGDELQAVETAFSAYIEKIIERNTQILRYNAAVILAARDRRAIQLAEERIAALNDRVLAHLRPDLPDLVSFVSRLYYASREQIMRTLDLTARAYRMWSLSDRKLLAEAYGGTSLADIRQETLAAASNTILSAYGEAIENFRTNTTPFPANAKDKGVLLAIAADQVDLFRSTNLIIAKPTTVTPDTGRAESPFAGMADIRVNQVRAWINGVKTSDNQLHVRITQAGNEDIVGTDGEVFRFSHEPITKTLVYDVPSRHIFQDADFGPGQNRDQYSETYAAIGPFATWQIEVRPLENEGLDLSAVTHVHLEFHGTSYSFDI